jgi:demethylmenaquinone methyltransferase/2-methoxy-6-polyprenyl-1,4-benzoquinol methylase
MKMRYFFTINLTKINADIKDQTRSIYFMKRSYPPVIEISAPQRIRMVKEIFSTVARRYDFLNHFLSLRRDIAWRRFTVQKMGFFQTFRFLDVATGTGDLAIAAARQYPQIQVVGLDFVQSMIDFAPIKVEGRGLSSRVKFLRSDALHLPFIEKSFDVAGIAFGIRNIPNKVKVLEEMKRVLVPGGQVMVLEMTAPRNRHFGKIYRIYLNRILPRIAQLFTQNPAAYYYLADSIMHFLDPEDSTRLMEEARLTRVEKYPLDFGITYLHIGFKAEEE